MPSRYRVKLVGKARDGILAKKLRLLPGVPMTEITTIREATAERVRLHRERRRRGLRCLMIEIRDREIDALVRHGLLDGEKRDDTAAIRAALHQYLDHTLGLC